MSIQTEINRIIAAVSAAHEKVSEKGGTTARPYLVENLEGAIDTIPIGVQLPTLVNPGKASDALSGKEFIDGSGNKITGTIATKTASNLSASGATVTVPAGYYASQATKSVATATQATPSISVSSAGLITASTTQTAGYVATGTKSATKQLTTQGAQTITPGTADKTIASGRYLTGAQTIKGDSNLVAGNIKSGVSIFGVAGSMKTGTELNFEVVGGTTQPGNPKENTIWVNTSTEITGWSFSPSEPEAVGSGWVWIKTGDFGSVKIQALAENEITLFPSGVMQYINGSFSKAKAMFYQDGAWKSTSRILFPSDIKFVGTAGSKAGYRINADTIELWQDDTGDANIANVYSNSTIAFEAGQTLVFDCKCTEQHAYADSDWAKFVGIYRAKNSANVSAITNMVAGVRLTVSSVRKEYSVPITTSGSYYVACCGGGDVVIYSIYVV